MKQSDYYLEFYDELDKRLEHFGVSSDRSRRSVCLAGVSVQDALQTHLFYRLSMERNAYNRCRRQGMAVEEAMSRVDAFLNRLRNMAPMSLEGAGEDSLLDVQKHPWREPLEECHGCVLVYVYNARQLYDLTPLINQVGRPVVLLSEYDIPDETELPEYVTALPVEFSHCRIFTDRDFECRFPLFFHYAHTFSILLQLMRPAGVICLEGCRFQEQLLAVEAENLGIPSYGIQRSWPSLMHGGFRRLPFRYYYTWGERFSRLWAVHNPVPSFVPLGYMYEVEPLRRGEEQSCVSFFLQAPVHLSDEVYFTQLLELIREAAERWPEVTFLVREHPEYRLDESLLRSLQFRGRVEIVSESPLNEIYARTRILVSHYSSSLMEGLLYGCRPLVFDPTDGSRYFPDVEKEGLGCIARTREEFMACLARMLEDNVPLGFQRQECFAATGTDTLDAMVSHLNQTLRPL